MCTANGILKPFLFVFLHFSVCVCVCVTVCVCVCVCVYVCVVFVWGGYQVGRHMPPPHAVTGKIMHLLGIPVKLCMWQTLKVKF